MSDYPDLPLTVGRPLADYFGHYIGYTHVIEKTQKLNGGDLVTSQVPVQQYGSGLCIGYRWLPETVFSKRRDYFDGDWVDGPHQTGGVMALLVVKDPRKKPIAVSPANVEILVEL